jgi:hypothetical protein
MSSSSDKFKLRCHSDRNIWLEHLAWLGALGSSSLSPFEAFSILGDTSRCCPAVPRIARTPILSCSHMCTWYTTSLFVGTESLVIFFCWTGSATYSRDVVAVSTVFVYIQSRARKFCAHNLTFTRRLQQPVLPVPGATRAMSMYVCWLLLAYIWVLFHHGRIFYTALVQIEFTDIQLGQPKHWLNEAQVYRLCSSPK